MRANKTVAIKILMLMYALIIQIKSNEHTRATAKMKQDIRKYLRLLWKHQRKWHDSLAQDSDEIWEKAKEIIRAENGTTEDFTISMKTSILALYILMERAGMPNIAFTENTLNKAIASIEGTQHETNNEIQVETDSNKLVDIFAKAMDFNSNSKLKIMRSRVSGNLMVDRRLKDEFA